VDRDVVEAFVGTDAGTRAITWNSNSPPPTSGWMGRKPAGKRFSLDSHFESAVIVDKKAMHWQAELRIPMKALADAPPAPGTKWRLNLFRSDRAQKAFLAWSPRWVNNTHVPERFGVLEFQE